ncbi:MAG: pentapeptide repeat-containing protein [Pseudomonadota bacterium]
MSPTTKAISGLVRDLRAQGSENIARDLRLRGIEPRTQLRGCDLSETDFHGLDFSEADFSDSNLKWTDFDRANLAGASFVGATLAQARLERADLTDADLRGANLRQTNLRRARFDGADLTGAVLDEWSPLGADFTGATLDTDAAAAVRITADPDRLLGEWTPASEDEEDEPPPPLSATSARLAMDGLLQCVYQAALFRCAGVDPVAFAPDAFEGPFSLFLDRTMTEIGVALNDARGELLLRRRGAVKKGHERSLPQVETHLGVCAILNRDFEEAAQFFESAMAQHKAQRDGVRVASLHTLEGLLALERLDHLTAVRKIRKAVEMFEGGGRPDGVLRHSICLAVLALQHGQLDRATQLMAKAAQTSAEPGPDLVAVSQTAIAGAIAWRLGASLEARAAWTKSATLLRDQIHDRCARLFDKLVEAAVSLS